MNIFYLHTDTKECAKQHLDKHVVKMILEYAQLLSTAHRLLDGTEYEGRTVRGTRKAMRWLLNDERETGLYMASHMKHPSGIWCRETSENYNWLYSLWRDLMREYTFRYGKHHVAEKLIPYLDNMPTNIKSGKITPMPQCMPDQYKVPGNSIQAYHNYYIGDKQRFAVWTNRPIPQWYVDAYRAQNHKAIAIKESDKVRFKMVPA
jgi:hypothetical protein